jgi:hypothetical protein
MGGEQLLTPHSPSPKPGREQENVGFSRWRSASAHPDSG